MHHHVSTLLTVAAVLTLVLVAGSLAAVIVRQIRRDNPQHPSVIDKQDRALIARLTAARDVEPTPADEPDDSLRETNPALLWMLRNGEREEARRLAESVNATAVAIGLPGYPPPPVIQPLAEDVEQLPVAVPSAYQGQHAPRRLGPLETIRLWLATRSLPTFLSKIPTGWDDPEGLDELHEMAEEHRERERERADVAAQRIAEVERERELRESMLTPSSGCHARCECGQCDDPAEVGFPDEPDAEPDCTVVAEVDTEGDGADVEPEDQDEEQAPQAPAVVEPERELLAAALFEQTRMLVTVSEYDPRWDHSGATGQLPVMSPELQAAIAAELARTSVSA